ncbi:MAG: hypothetical protein PVJ53_02190 [Desulfobacterales bacterium]|jgi:hypothetical protein
MAPSQTNSAKFDGAAVGLFLLIIILPVVLIVLPWDQNGPRLTEKRRLAEQPALPAKTVDLIAYPRQFERYFDDHFPFRTQLIQGHNYLKIKVLNQSDQRYVVMGREGWLFYTHESLLEDFCGRVPFTDERMAAFRRMVEAKRDWLAARGIAYIFVIPPNKQTVYPEYMPENFVRARGRTRMDQLMAYMQAHSDVTIVDLRQVLIDAKARDRLYYLTDSHWNDLGALVGYGAIMRAVGRALGRDVGVVRTREDFDIRKAPRQGGDLASMLGLRDQFREDDFILSPRWEGGTCAKKQALPDYLGPTWKLRRDPFAMTCARADITMVMFRDSFGTRLVPFLAEHFRRSAFIQMRNYEAAFFKAVVEKEQPDIVIDECGERVLYYLETGPRYRPED